MPNTGMIALISMIVLAVIVALIIPMAQKATAAKAIDPFVGNSGLPALDKITRPEYHEIGKKRYNYFSDTNDVTRGNFARANAPAEVETVNNSIQHATRTSYLSPDTTSPTLLGVDSETTDYKLPPSSALLANAKQCEAAQGRGACSKLGKADFKNCGVCIKEGTAYTKPDTPNAFMGGMLILPEDRAIADSDKTEYLPTIGECLPGYFYVDRAACEKAVNREDCKESGETGGFQGGRTIEGKSVIDQKCAQVPYANTFIYDTKNRAFNMNLRVLTPVGSGACRVYVLNAKNQQVGYGALDTPGVEFLVPIRNVKEGEELQITVVEEVAYRVPSGKNEVFQYNANLAGKNETGYTFTKDIAKATCERIGASHATDTQLESAMANGTQACSLGWTTGNTRYPMQGLLTKGGCGRNGMNSWGVTAKARAWCYGAKPPQNINNVLYTHIFPWFTSMAHMEPSQENNPTVWSQHGADYQAPYYRAILIQYESVDGKQRIPLEQTIQSVNNVGRDSAGNIKILRRLGTYSRSNIIHAPRPVAGSRLLTNNFWIWSNQFQSQQFTMKVMIPGTFLGPVYEEDKPIVGSSILITNPETAKLLKTNPCFESDQKSGAYGDECLKTLFLSAGGDIYNGQLARNGLDVLNEYGSMDDISAYLSDLYTTATKGRKSDGIPASMTEINDAAQKLFGFDIANPCEDIYEDERGNIAIQPKRGALNADCLDYLWKNTGSDKSRGDEDGNRNTTLKNTYTTIADRYSGLRMNEGTEARRKNAPFAACQTAGKMAPINSIGEINTAAVAAANSKGRLDMIQRFYDSIHKTANYRGSNKDAESAHKLAMDQCYGIQSAPVIEKPCGGVRARYVRVLATTLRGVSDIVNNPIQIPQIQVFDITGREVAKQKRTSALTSWPGTSPDMAVNGDARPKSHSEGQYHTGSSVRSADFQFWMVDLGQEFSIARIVYYPRTDCCTDRQIGAPVQLLNSSMRIVAQKLLGSTNVPKRTWGPRTPEELKFDVVDTVPKIPIRSLIPSRRIQLFSATGFNHVLNASSTGVNIQIPKSANEGLFTISPANTGLHRAWSIGFEDFISLQSVSFPNNFLVHENFRIQLRSRKYDRIFSVNSSFKIVPALNGDPTMFSLQSAADNTYYIATNRFNPSEVWMTRVNVQNVWDVQRVCWKAV